MLSRRSWPLQLLLDLTLYLILEYLCLSLLLHISLDNLFCLEPFLLHLLDLQLICVALALEVSYVYYDGVYSQGLRRRYKLLLLIFVFGGAELRFEFPR